MSEVSPQPSVSLLSQMAGTYCVEKECTENVVYECLKSGVSAIDTAELYKNETEVMSALKRYMNEYNRKRSEFFIVTKIFLRQKKEKEDESKEIREEEKKLIIEKIHARLEIFEEIDCLLLHFPTVRFLSIWNFMHSYIRSNSLPIRHLGVSNFKVWHLEELLNTNSPLPFCNQIEASPFWNRDDIVAFCQKHNILITAHSPLAKGRKAENQILQQIAQKHSCSWAQVMLAFLFNKGYYPIFRSKNKDHVEENLKLPTLSWEDMNLLESISKEEPPFATHQQYL